MKQKMLYGAKGTFPGMPKSEKQQNCSPIWGIAHKYEQPYHMSYTLVLLRIVLWPKHEKIIEIFHIHLCVYHIT
jgi:hypothetical protein